MKGWMLGQVRLRKLGLFKTLPRVQVYLMNQPRSKCQVISSTCHFINMDKIVERSNVVKRKSVSLPLRSGHRSQVRLAYRPLLGWQKSKLMKWQVDKTSQLRFSELFLVVNLHQKFILKLQLHSNPVAGIPIHNTSFSSYLTNGPNKLDRYITLTLKTLPGTNTFSYWVHLKVTKKMKCCKYGPSVCIHNT